MYKYIASSIYKQYINTFGYKNYFVITTDLLPILLKSLEFIYHNLAVNILTYCTNSNFYKNKNNQ